MSDQTGAGAPLIEVAGVSKSYVKNSTRTDVLQDVSFRVAAGETLAVIGPSGAGKSTLLNILGTLDRPTGGTLRYRGQAVFDRAPRPLARFRNRSVGFVFQFHHLLPEFDALENVMLPACIGGMPPARARQQAGSLLTRMGLDRRLHHTPGELSGGEQQRVAVARALVMGPEVVLADEPTGNLDTHTGEAVFDLLLELNREMGMTLIVVTHNLEFAGKVSRCITLVDGRISSDSAAPNRTA